MSWNGRASRAGDYDAEFDEESVQPYVLGASTVVENAKLSRGVGTHAVSATPMPA